MYESLQLQYEELYMFLKENSRKSKVSSEWEWENGGTRKSGWVGREERERRVDGEEREKRERRVDEEEGKKGEGREVGERKG